MAMANAENVDLGNGPDYGQRAEQKYKKIIEDYKQYLGTVSEPVAKEVREYRIEVEKLNQQKRMLFKKMSQEAQMHLKAEQEFKRKLPRKQR